MIRDYPLTVGRSRSILAREALAMTAATLLYPLGWLKRSRQTPRQAEQRTIVLIHGYAANSSCFTALQAYLRLVGQGPVLTYSYPLSASVEQAAIDLKAFLKDRVRGGRIDLVAHSLGGLVALVYLCELSGARRVDRCITLGTPHRGTYNSYWIRGRIARDLRPDSVFLQRIRAASVNARRVKFTAVVAASDNIIVPRVYAAGKVDTVVMPELGHMGLLFSPQVFRVIAERLASPRGRKKQPRAS